MSQSSLESELQELNLLDLVCLCYDNEAFRSIYDDLTQKPKETELRKKLLEYAKKEVKLLNKLQDAVSQLKTDSSPKETLVVVAAMTQKEARALLLDKEYAKDKELLKGLWNLFGWKQELHTSEIESIWARLLNCLGVNSTPQPQTDDSLQCLVACYGEKREHWRPWGFENVTADGQLTEVSESIEQIVDGYSKHLPDYKEPLNPKYISEEFFSKDEGKREEASKYLQDKDAILIIDLITLCHPDVMHILKNHEVLARPSKVPVVVILPITKPISEIHGYFEERISKGTYLAKIFKHFIKCNPHYAFGVSSRPMLYQHLLVGVPLTPHFIDIYDKVTKMPNKNKYLVETQAKRQNIQEKGFGRFIGGK